MEQEYTETNFIQSSDNYNYEINYCLPKRELTRTVSQIYKKDDDDSTEYEQIIDHYHHIIENHTSNEHEKIKLLVSEKILSVIPIIPNYDTDCFIFLIESITKLIKSIANEADDKTKSAIINLAHQFNQNAIIDKIIVWSNIDSDSKINIQKCIFNFLSLFSDYDTKAVTCMLNEIFKKNPGYLDLGTNINKDNLFSLYYFVQLLNKISVDDSSHGLLKIILVDNCKKFANCFNRLVKIDASTKEMACEYIREIVDNVRHEKDLCRDISSIVIYLMDLQNSSVILPNIDLLDCIVNKPYNNRKKINYLLNEELLSQALIRLDIRDDNLRTITDLYNSLDGYEPAINRLLEIVGQKRVISSLSQKTLNSVVANFMLLINKFNPKTMTYIMKSIFKENKDFFNFSELKTYDDFENYFCLIKEYTESGYTENHDIMNYIFKKRSQDLLESLNEMVNCMEATKENNSKKKIQRLIIKDIGSLIRKTNTVLQQRIINYLCMHQKMENHTYSETFGHSLGELLNDLKAKQGSESDPAPDSASTSAFEKH